MTTTKEAPQVTPVVPEVLTEEHHEALKASWELPAYEREAPKEIRPAKPKPYRALLVGLVAGAVGLGVGFAAGYLVSEQLAEPAQTIVIERVPGPVDANGYNLGRRVAPFETGPAYPLPVRGPVDANGYNLGRRVAPFETGPAYPIATPALQDANGYNLGRRVAPIEYVSQVVYAPKDANGYNLGRRVAPIEA